MIDSHCHLDFAAFDQDREQQIALATCQGVTDFILPGVQASQWPALIRLCQTLPSLHFALGLHPYFLSDYAPQHLVLLEALLSEQHGHVVAVGEIGIDLAIEVDGGFQESLFCTQLELAQQHRLPVIVHHRKSHHRIMHCLKACGFKQGGVVHAFSGSLQQAERYLDMGFKLGIGGTITYPRAAKTRETVRQLPLDAIVLETDSPDMPMLGYQGQRNSPANLGRVLDSLAELLNLDRKAIETHTDRNTRALFKLGSSAA